MKQTFYFTGIAKIGITHTPGDAISRLEETSIRLEVSKNLDKDKYLRRELPTKEGVKPLSNTFIHGLIANIKVAHQKGWWNEAEHMRYVIDQLERAFASAELADPDIQETFLEDEQ